MNNIPILQNEQKQLEKLSAQRELYSDAKNWYIFQVIGTLVIPLVLVLLSFFVTNLSLIAAIYGIAFFIVDIIFIIPNISKLKLKAAKIQELFDCEVLRIPSSPLKTASDITVEEVLTYYESHNKIKSNVERLRDWYPPIIGNTEIEFARLICQRTNCWWDRVLRKRYINFIRAIAIIIPLIVIVAGAVLKIQTENIVLLLSALMPFFRFANKEYSDQKSSNDRLERTMNYILKLWENILSNQIEKDKLTIESRIIQDEIYENRSKSPFVFDIIYKAFRDKSESLMNKSAAILVSEIENMNINPSK